MFFNLLAAFVILAFTGCSLRLNDEVVKTEVKVNPMQQGCLSKAGETTALYLDAKLSDDELDVFWNCMDKAVYSFGQYTKGRAEDRFAGEEMAAFLSKYFLKDKQISPTLLHEILVLKASLIGGNEKEVSKEELGRILDLYKVLRRVSHRLRPILPLNVDSFRARGFKQPEFDSAMDIFQSSMGEIGVALSSTQGSYTFEHMETLLTALRAQIYGPAEKDLDEQGHPVERWPDRAACFAKALPSAKAMFVGLPTTEMRQEDWLKVYQLLPRYYALFLRARFFAQSESKFVKGTSVAALERIGEDFLDLLQSSLKNHPNGEITGPEIDDMIAALTENKILDIATPTAPITGATTAKMPSTAQVFAKALFMRLLGDGKTYAVNQGTIDRLKQDLLFGTEGLRAIEGAFHAELGEDFASGSLPAARFLAHPAAELLGYTNARGGDAVKAVESVREIAKSVKTIFPNNSAVVFIPERKTEQPLSFSHLAGLHIMRTLNRMVFRAYGKPEGVSQDSLLEAANELMPVLEEMKLLGPETRASIPSRLMEASLFLYSSDGNDIVSPTEALEFESLLISTMRRGGAIHAEIAKLCHTPEEKDQNGKILPAVIEAKCFRDTFLYGHKGDGKTTNGVATYWAYIPGFAKFFAPKPMFEQRALFASLEGIIRKDVENRARAPFKKGDTLGLILLPYYVELLFSRFDKDGDGYFNNAESEAAYPVFQPLIAKKAHDFQYDTDEDHRAIFNFLLAYQKLPNEDKIAWGMRYYVFGNKTFKVDRAQVTTIFGKLLSKKK